MKDLFYEGGLAFMSILSLLLIAMVAWQMVHLFAILNSKEPVGDKALRNVGYGKSIGLFALIFGIFGQLIGLYQAFSVIVEVGDISPSLIYGGIKVSMISILYGIAIYLLSLLVWFLLCVLIERRRD